MKDIKAKILRFIVNQVCPNKSSKRHVIYFVINSGIEYFFLLTFFVIKTINSTVN